MDINQAIVSSEKLFIDHVDSTLTFQMVIKILRSPFECDCLPNWPTAKTSGKKQNSTKSILSEDSSHKFAQKKLAAYENRKSKQKVWRKAIPIEFLSLSRGFLGEKTRNVSRFFNRIRAAYEPHGLNGKLWL